MMADNDERIGAMIRRYVTQPPNGGERALEMIEELSRLSQQLDNMTAERNGLKEHADHMQGVVADYRDQIRTYEEAIAKLRREYQDALEMVKILSDAVETYLIVYGNSNRPNNPGCVRDKMIEAQAAIKKMNP